MLAREHRLGVVIALVIGAWSSSAHASFTMTPGTIATPETDVDVTSDSATGTLSSMNEPNQMVDFVIQTDDCSGSGMGTFALNPTSVNLNMPRQVSVTYTPSQAGNRSCPVHVYPKNNTDGTPLTTFTITGIGSTPPVLEVDDVELPFPAVRFHDSAVAAHTSHRDIIVRNTGGRPLMVTNVTLTGDFALDASTPQTTATINANTQRTWRIRFNPSQLGNRTGTITFESNGGSATKNLDGNGTSGVVSITAVADDGDFDTVSGGSTRGLDITVTHTGNAPKGIATLSSVTVTPADMTKAWFAITAAPNTLNNNTQTGTITVSCSPPTGSTDTATATVTVVADNDPDSTAMLTQQVSCTAGSSLLALAPASEINFGSQLVDMPTGMQMLTLSNGGNEEAAVRFTSDSTNRDRFTLMTPDGCGLSMAGDACPVTAGGNIQVMARFTPTDEGTVSASFRIEGSGGLGFILTGRGIDRHMVLPMTMQFPDTFRNPGQRATVLPVTLANEGEYPIVVSALQMNGEPIWSIVEPTPPFTIDGLASTDVLVRFAPVAAGKVDDGILIVSNDDLDVAGGTPAVLLRGNGKERNVDMTPGAVDVGETFAGVPTRLSFSRPDDMLLVTNLEQPDDMQSTDFRIREIKVEGEHAAMFEVVDLDGDSVSGRMLPAGESFRVDVIFKPTHVGEFEANLAIYLDEDPIAQKPVPVRGRALYVDARGSGGFGCSTTGRGSHGALVLVAGVLAFLVGRRRR